MKNNFTYCESLTEYKRFKTREVSVGDIPLGGNNPVRIQSMTTTDTMDTIATVEQTIRMVNAGCEYVRITAPSINEANNLAEIKKELHRRGCSVPLIADIHFTPNAAEVAARIVEKVRINPGNYVDKKKFKEIEYTDISWFNGKVIATSYPEILGDFLKEKNVNADIHVITCSVEIAPSIGLADAIFDIVSSGSTLVTNHLKEVEVLMKSEALLISNPNLSSEKQAILDELLFRIDAVQIAEDKKYVLMNVPTENIEKIIEVLPGIKSPTIMPLAKEGWNSLHAVIDEKRFWDIIGKLKTFGAEGILVIPIEKMIL